VAQEQSLRTENSPFPQIIYFHSAAPPDRSKRFVCFAKGPYWTRQHPIQSVPSSRVLLLTSHLSVMMRLGKCGACFHSSTHRHSLCRILPLQTLWAYMYVISTGSDFLFSWLIVTLKVVTEQEVTSCLSSPAQGYQSNSFLVATGSVSIPRVWDTNPLLDWTNYTIHHAHGGCTNLLAIQDHVHQSEWNTDLSHLIY
jgi:hypothetical protein